MLEPRGTAFRTISNMIQYVNIHIYVWTTTWYMITATPHNVCWLPDQRPKACLFPCWNNEWANQMITKKHVEQANCIGVSLWTQHKTHCVSVENALFTRQHFMVVVQTQEFETKVDFVIQNQHRVFQKLILQYEINIWFSQCWCCIAKSTLNFPKVDFAIQNQHMIFRKLIL